MPPLATCRACMEIFITSQPSWEIGNTQIRDPNEVEVYRIQQ